MARPARSPAWIRFEPGNGRRPEGGRDPARGSGRGVHTFSPDPMAGRFFRFDERILPGFLEASQKTALPYCTRIGFGQY